MIRELVQVKINGKTYVPIDDLIEDLEKHLNNEITDVDKEDKYGFEVAAHEAMSHLSLYTDEVQSGEWREILETLKSEPCDDCISRKAVNILVDELARAISDERCCISRGRSTAAIMQDILDLHSVTPQDPKGKWIKIQSGDKDFPESIVCSRCKNENSHFEFDEHSEPIEKILVTSKYCPNCGAKMEVSE